MRFLAAIGVVAICVAVAGAIYFFGGFYNVAAVGGGNAAVEWAVRSVREVSVDNHADAPPQPDWFGQPEAVQAGAKMFVKGGCIDCHGGPGVKPEKFAEGMDPNPPDLGDVGEEDAPGTIFWVVKNGIRMTGMPGFGIHAKDEEIWRLVSFVKAMKDVSPEQMKQWTPAGNEGEAAEGGGEQPSGGSGSASAGGGAGASNGSSGPSSSSSASGETPAGVVGGGANQ